MRRLFAWLGAAALVAFTSVHTAEAKNDVLKPFVVLILDTSGSMTNATNQGPTSCGTSDTKFNHAVCAINNIVNSFGDIVWALGRFRESASGTTTAGTFPTGCTLVENNGVDHNVANGCTANDDMFELLTPVVDGNHDAATWTNLTGNTCLDPTVGANGLLPTGVDPEIWQAPVNQNTPLGGTLKGAKRYWQGLDASGFTLSAATESGTTATFTTSVNHRLYVGESIEVSGVTPAGYNGDWIVLTVADNRHFTATLATAGLGAATAFGTASAAYWFHAKGGFSPIVADTTNNIFFPAGCDSSATCTGASCCTNQCRPYITIMLTDGDETCGGDPAAAAATMIKTAVGGKNYRVETKPIGFGITPPTASTCDNKTGVTGCQIEDIAHAGGAPDVAGVNEGFYAADQAGVELAISEILAGAARTELCNNQDDDCDTKIDEDFPDKNKVCTNGLQGVCAVNGTLVCRTDGAGLVCNAGTAVCNGKADGTNCNVTNTAGASEAGKCQTGVCVPTPGTEVCNGLDDDCDGKVDEGLDCTTTCQPEICNGKDDDCDGKVDEDTTVACGINVGVCTTGTQVCQCDFSTVPPTCGLSACSGAQPCGGATPCVDSCNGKDDDCDGVVDGIVQACSNLSGTFPAGDPRNNPGQAGGVSPGCIAEGPAVCACHPGNKLCPAQPEPGTGTNTFGPCTGEAVPAGSDPCDGIDNDCDGKVDEDFVPAACGSCGGQTVCVAGTIQCNIGTGSTEVCNGADDDCDGNIDEGLVDGTSDCGGGHVCGEACGGGTVCNGKIKCVGGAPQCVGTPIVQESCNCLDDDCDGKTDEDNGNCPSGSTCTKTGAACECAFQCDDGEIKCPLGKTCDPTSNLCVTDPCFGVTCNPDNTGAVTTCVGGSCVTVCSTKNCAGGFVCKPDTGECIADDCSNFPDKCTADQRCVNGVCESNPCAGVTCSNGEYCEAGTCIKSCADVTCPDGQRCRLGACEADPCGKTCPAGDVCNDDSGACVKNPCTIISCGVGQYCDPNDDGRCKDDPCAGTMCPSADQQCLGGTCFIPPKGPDGGVEEHVTTGGGGCQTGSDGGALLLLGVGVVLGALRRKQNGRRA